MIFNAKFLPRKPTAEYWAEETLGDLGANGLTSRRCVDLCGIGLKASMDE